MRQSDITLDEYWVTHSGHSRLTTTVALGTRITYGKLLFYHGISEGSVDKKFSTREYKNMTVYDCFNNTFPYYCSRPALNISTITIDDGPLPHKLSRYTPDLLSADISVASKNSDNTLPPLLIHQDSLSYLMIILTLPIP